jgi:predicted transcriptional regulator
MVPNLALPQLSGKSVSTRDQIISILSQEWPLTARALYAKVQKESDSALSYQAVHKALLNLEVEGIVERLGNGYQVNLEWVNNLKGFSDKILETYKLEKSSDFSGSKVVDFYNPFDFFRGMLNIFCFKDTY